MMGQCELAFVAESWELWCWVWCCCCSVTAFTFNPSDVLIIAIGLLLFLPSAVSLILAQHTAHFLTTRTRTPIQPIHYRLLSTPHLHNRESNSSIEMDEWTADAERLHKRHNFYYAFWTLVEKVPSTWSCLAAAPFTGHKDFNNPNVGLRAGLTAMDKKKKGRRESVQVQDTSK